MSSYFKVLYNVFIIILLIGIGVIFDGDVPTAKPNMIKETNKVTDEKPGSDYNCISSMEDSLQVEKNSPAHKQCKIEEVEGFDETDTPPPKKCMCFLNFMIAMSRLNIENLGLSDKKLTI